jgi:hypothetical protein
MKYIIILTTLLLLNCADNITNKHYSTRSNAGTNSWCSVEKWNSGAIKEIYTLRDVQKYDKQGTEIYIVAVDSVRGDSTFVSNDDLKAVIVDEPFSEEYKIALYNSWYDMEMENWGYTELYSGGEDFVKCVE